ncbi:MAG TPA: hypothetical protein DDW67_06800 [Elusimicrobia bacterium]|nr:hypothetical protein [Elusimicrobiota bacterium]
MDAFSSHNGIDPGGPLRAAAALFILKPGSVDRREAARLLYGSSPGNLPYALIWLGEEEYSAAALEEFSRDLKADPYPLAAGALLYASRGEKAAALELARAASRGPLSEAGWQLAMQAFQSAGAYGEGISAAGAALSAWPDSAALLNSRGVLRSLSGDDAGARADFGRALEKNPAYFPALMGLGAIMERGGETEKAAELYRSALKNAGPGRAGAGAAEKAILRLGRRPL